MAHENWQQVKEIFIDAMRRTPEERPHFLAEACRDNPPLRQEVESLLSSLDDAESFLESPAVDDANGNFSDVKTLPTGFTFGHYLIVKPIGIGGMGEVYLARDQKLDRQVAVKILNAKFSQHESNLQRFMREAKTASSLNHPNILVIHEIGETDDTHYIVSEYVEGNTLRELFNHQNLTWKELLDIFIQIANALSVAHQAHLIHRDIKPENIMIRPDGLVKILDFGLAKLLQREDERVKGRKGEREKQSDLSKNLLSPQHPFTPSPILTNPGVIMGTVNYMSPEQAKGEKVDERTDIFSFGVMLYEVLAGRTPFAGDSMAETLANLINKEPKPLSDFTSNVPEELQNIVSKTLGKNKNERYQTIAEVLTDLKAFQENQAFDKKPESRTLPDNLNQTQKLRATTGGLTRQTNITISYLSQQIKQHKSLSAIILLTFFAVVIGFGYYFFIGQKPALGADDKRTIAVLPLKPLSPENRDARYELGIADALIQKLSPTKNLLVRQLSAVQDYTDTKKDAVAIGKEQQVNYILASNYQISDGKIRITSQLINVTDGSVEDSFKDERNIADIFALQDAIAANIGQKILTKLNRESNNLTAKRYTNNEEAYRLYLTGKALTDKRNRKDVEKAVEYLEQAVQLDPNYALAFAQLANAHNALSIFRDDKYELYLKQKTAIEKALAIDENLAEGYAQLGEMRLNYEWDFDGAERAFKKALELDPNSVVAHRNYGLYLNSMGRFDESIIEFKTAIDLEPASPLNHKNYGMTLYYARRYDEAIAELERTAATNPEFQTLYSFLINSYNFKGDSARAFEWDVRLMTVVKVEPETIEQRKKIFAKSGWRGILQDEIRNALEVEKEGSDVSWLLLRLYAELGDKEKALAVFENALNSNKRGWAWTTLKIERRFDWLRPDPRFQDLVRRVGFK